MTETPTRRRVIVSSNDTVEVITETVPALKPGEALVEMSVSECVVLTRPASTASTLS